MLLAGRVSVGAATHTFAKLAPCSRETISIWGRTKKNHKRANEQTKEQANKQATKQAKRAPERRIVSPRPGRRHLLLTQKLDCARICPQIQLQADQQFGSMGCVVQNLGEPPGAQVLERGRPGDAETDENDITLRIAPPTQVVVFAASRLKKENP